LESSIFGHRNAASHSKDRSVFFPGAAMNKIHHDITQAPVCAEIILQSLDEYLENFQAITHRAPIKFEKKDWKGGTGMRMNGWICMTRRLSGS
jgi:hypothetical protein